METVSSLCLCEIKYLNYAETVSRWKSFFFIYFFIMDAALTAEYDVVGK